MANKSQRNRLRTAPIGPLLTLSSGAINHEHETFILEEAASDNPFHHWTAHLRAFWGWYSEEPDYRAREDDLPKLKAMIADGLENAEFAALATPIRQVSNDEELNGCLIEQYTDDTGLYSEVNRILRTAHSGAKLKGHPLVPWMLQFNCAVRLRPQYEGVAYRGTQMSGEDIGQYTPGLMFEWAPFVSASKEVNACLGGNVMFEITPWGSYCMYDKRNSYDLSALSVFPEENEVIFPIACTYRVTDKRDKGGVTWINLETVDQY